MRALQIWVSRVTSNYNSIEITDLTTSFRNGLAFVGIIHHFKPDLITNPDKLDPEDIMGNNDLAYKVAEEKLQIPSLLDSEDMLATDEPDKFSIGKVLKSNPVPTVCQKSCFCSKIEF